MAIQTGKPYDVRLVAKTTGLEDVAEIAEQISAKAKELDALICKLASTTVTVEVKCQDPQLR